MPALIFETRNHIAYLTLNRPEVHNAFNPETLVLLADAWTRIERDAEVRVVILTGAGTRAFSAGADLGRLTPLQSGARPPEDEYDHQILANPRLADIAILRGDFHLTKPVIAAVNGFCLAGGMELMTAADLRVAAEQATFGLPEVKWAVVPAKGSLARLTRQIPYCKAMELLLTGSTIDAREAYRLGLVNYVVPPEQVIAKAEELANAIAENGPLAVRKIKEAAERCSGRPLEQSFQIEDEVWREVIASEDAREGPRAFMEKRKPRYQGR